MSRDTRRVGKVPMATVMFTAGYLAIAAAAAPMQGNREFLIYIAVMAVLIATVVVIHRRIGFDGTLLWAMSIWGLLHMAGGLVPVPERWPIDGENRVLYNLWLIPGWFKFDHFVHAYGFGVAGWACWQALSRLAPGVRATAGPLFLVVCASMGLGAMNEIVEFAAVLTLPNTNVGGYENTGWDLVFNLIGALCAATLIRVAAHRRS